MNSPKKPDKLRPERPYSTVQHDHDNNLSQTLSTALDKAVLRLKTDLRLAIVTLFAFVSIVLITPFVVFRFVVGDVLIGFIDLLIVASFAAALIHGWYSGNSAVAGNATAFLAVIATVFVVYVLELDHSWAFAALSACFVLARLSTAIILSGSLITLLAVRPGLFESFVDLTTFIVVAMMISLFGLIYSSRVDSQHQRLKELAVRDSLTGAMNRRAMDLRLAMEVEKFRKSPGPVSVAMLDLDRFKRLNDRHGHEAGDKVLIELARIIRENTRTGDWFFRYGGEEFVLVMPDTDLNGLDVALPNLRRLIEENLKAPDGQAVTVSIGGAELASGESWTDWLIRADQALFAAKKAGRNRVELSPKPEDEGSR